MKKNKRKLKFMFIYILAATGIWMFLCCCSNSYNHISEDKISPAGIIITENSANINILHSEYKLKTDVFKPESRIYYILYLFPQMKQDLLPIFRRKNLV